ncbi:hypothetical protein RI129_005895 [Pyrocoelia pectoralis]|uniref:Uncharacterized protein n=1 Tax=Pyrocoelia pectoralis TaxID=417401 RepID=A0AAN7VA88_9COLE
MTNRPFTSHNTNILTETFYSSAPSRIGSDTVILTHSAKRTLYDQKTTSISKNIPHVKQQTYNTNYINRNLCKDNFQRNVMPALKEFFPGGVSFSFNPVGQHFVNQPPNSSVCTNQHNASQPLTLEQQIALKELEKNSLELMIMQEKLKKNPFKLKFNYDKCTSTSDLPNAAQQIPQSHDPSSSQNKCNLGVSFKVENVTSERSSENPTSSNTNKTKKLMLIKSPDLQEPQTLPDEDQCGKQNIENKKSEHKPRSNKKRKNKKKSKKKGSEYLEEDDYSDSSISD